jgi:uncharacterized protein YuzE
VKYRYDEDADALYVRLRDESVARSVVVDEGRVIDLAENGEPVGIEITGASASVSLSDLVDRFSLARYAPELARIERMSFAPRLGA